ncbi:MAG: transcriptional repressor [Sinobacteraceae bacterium]|nr:transcriptional repressor [Nevskiaceae bacterium]
MATHRNSSQSLATATATASAPQQVHGWRLGSTQARLYQVLQHVAGPLTAYELLNALNADSASDGSRKVYPQTVYRGLAQLQERGLVHRVESTNAYLACQSPTRPHRSIHLLCDRCGKAQELIDRRVSRSLDADAARYQFNLERQVVELHGVCAHCAHAESHN